MAREAPWDYIIVGGGSAGVTLASRLSERPDRRVLLLEAGGADRHPAIHIPGMLETLLTSKKLNWQFAGEPDDSLHGRRLTWAAGRVIGGSSSINGMVYGRGLPADYASWVEAGNPGWGWNDMLPYFRKLEDWQGASHATRGIGGPVSVRPFTETDTACQAALRAFIAAGVPFVDDYSVGISQGIGLTQATQKRGWRHSAADAYLRPARRRANLNVRTGARVDRLRIEHGRCTGVTYMRHGRVRTARADREVILAAGAIGTPKLLLLSGIGAPGSVLEHGIALVHELPGVGRGLNDHVNIRLSAFVNVPTYNTQRRGPAAWRHGLRLLTHGTGPATSPANHCQAFIKTDSSLSRADIQVQLMAFGFGTEAEMRRDGITAVVSPCQPRARGEVRLRSADPHCKPRIVISMLGTDADIEVLLKGCRFAHAMLLAGPGRRYGGQVYAPRAGTASDREWIEFFRENAGLNWHPTSTCRMGPDPSVDVVDSHLRVHGVAGLSIADASVMPNVTSANTNVPVIAIAERAAEMIDARSRNEGLLF
jgi:choline dehydrogenase